MSQEEQAPPAETAQSTGPDKRASLSPEKLPTGLVTATLPGQAITPTVMRQSGQDGENSPVLDATTLASSPVEITPVILTPTPPRSPRSTRTPAQTTPTFPAPPTLEGLPPAPPTETLQFREPLQSSEAIKQLKERLFSLGYPICSNYAYFNTISNYYTRQTELAVMRFQMEHQLPPTGRVDATTWVKVFSASAHYADQANLTAGEVSSPTLLPQDVRSLAYDGQRLWVITAGAGDQVQAINPQTGAAEGVFTFTGVPTGYPIQGLAWDGQKLWGLFQGPLEALLQRFSTPAPGSQNELAGELAQPVKISSLLARSLSYSGGRLWVTVEISTRGTPFIQPFDVQSGLAGAALYLQRDQFPNPAWEEKNDTWSVVDGVAGDLSLIKIDQATRQITHSGLCGSQVVVESPYAWLAHQNKIIAYDLSDLSPELQIQLPIDVEIVLLTSSGERIWLLDTANNLRWVIRN